MSGSDAASFLPGVQEASRPRTGIVVDGVYIGLSSLDLPRLLRRTTYYTRAWILQEQWLSRSVIYFGDHQVYFRCGSDLRDETLRDESYSYRTHNPIADLLNRRKTPESPPDWYRSSCAYELVTKEYSQKAVTYPTDVLHTFSGLQSVFEKYWDCVFFYGLSESIFDLALLWPPSHRSPGRRRDIIGVDVKHPSFKSPTWSWVGWKGSLSQITDHHVYEAEYSKVSYIRDSPKPGISSDITAFGVVVAGDYHVVRRREGCDFIKFPGTRSNRFYDAYLRQLAIPLPSAVSSSVLLFESRVVSTSHFDFSIQQLDRLQHHNIYLICDKRGHNCGFLHGCLESLFSVSRGGSHMCDLVRLSLVADICQLPAYLE